MTNAGINLVALQQFRESPVWALLATTLTAEMNKSLVPPAITGELNAIAIATISRSATYHALAWVRDRMLAEMIEQERKALAE